MTTERVEERVPVAAGAIGALRSIAPGLALCTVLAFISFQAEPLTTKATAALFGKPITITAPVLALLIGMVLHPVAAKPQFGPGFTFAIKKLLRWAIALFGLKIAVSDIIGLGFSTAAMVIVSMMATLGAGILISRLLGRGQLYGALAGSAAAVCGASAALATASVLPPYPQRDADTVFVVINVNVLATAAMVLYPPICAMMGFDDRTTGIFLGATIHDVAQVVGAGYAVSDAAGNTATVVKLFRVFLLLPVVLGIGWWFSSQGGDFHRAKVPVPVFAIMFLVFVIISSTELLPHDLKAGLIEASRWGLLVAIAALGLNSSFMAIVRSGPRHLAVILVTTTAIFILPLAWLALYPGH